MPYNSPDYFTIASDDPAVKSTIAQSMNVAAFKVSLDSSEGQYLGVNTDEVQLNLISSMYSGYKTGDQSNLENVYQGIISSDGISSIQGLKQGTLFDSICSGIKTNHFSSYSDYTASLYSILSASAFYGYYKTQIGINHLSGFLNKSFSGMNSLLGSGPSSVSEIFTLSQMSGFSYGDIGPTQSLIGNPSPQAYFSGVLAQIKTSPKTSTAGVVGFSYYDLSESFSGYPDGNKLKDSSIQKYKITGAFYYSDTSWQNTSICEDIYIPLYYYDSENENKFDPFITTGYKLIRASDNAECVEEESNYAPVSGTIFEREFVDGPYVSGVFTPSVISELQTRDKSFLYKYDSSAQSTNLSFDGKICRRCTLDGAFDEGVITVAKERLIPHNPYQSIIEEEANNFPSAVDDLGGSVTGQLHGGNARTRWGKFFTGYHQDEGVYYTPPNLGYKLYETRYEAHTGLKFATLELDPLVWGSKYSGLQYSPFRETQDGYVVDDLKMGLYFLSGRLYEEPTVSTMHERQTGVAKVVLFGVNRKNPYSEQRDPLSYSNALGVPATVESFDIDEPSQLIHYGYPSIVSEASINNAEKPIISFYQDFNSHSFNQKAKLNMGIGVVRTWTDLISSDPYPQSNELVDSVSLAEFNPSDFIDETLHKSSSSSQAIVTGNISILSETLNGTGWENRIKQYAFGMGDNLNKSGSIDQEFVYKNAGKTFLDRNYNIPGTGIISGESALVSFFMKTGTQAGSELGFLSDLNSSLLGTNIKNVMYSDAVKVPFDDDRFWKTGKVFFRQQGESVDTRSGLMFDPRVVARDDSEGASSYEFSLSSSASSGYNDPFKVAGAVINLLDASYPDPDLVADFSRVELSGSQKSYWQNIKMRRRMDFHPRYYQGPFASTKKNFLYQNAEISNIGLFNQVSTNDFDKYKPLKENYGDDASSYYSAATQKSDPYNIIVKNILRQLPAFSSKIKFNVVVEERVSREVWKGGTVSNSSFDIDASGVPSGGFAVSYGPIPDSKFEFSKDSFVATNLVDHKYTEPFLTNSGSYYHHIKVLPSNTDRNPFTYDKQPNFAKGYIADIYDLVGDAPFMRFNDDGGLNPNVGSLWSFRKYLPDLRAIGESEYKNPDGLYEKYKYHAFQQEVKYTLPMIEPIDFTYNPKHSIEIPGFDLKYTNDFSENFEVDGQKTALYGFYKSDPLYYERISSLEFITGRGAGRHVLEKRLVSGEFTNTGGANTKSFLINEPLSGDAQITFDYYLNSASGSGFGWNPSGGGGFVHSRGMGGDCWLGMSATAYVDPRAGGINESGYGTTVGDPYDAVYGNLPGRNPDRDNQIFLFNIKQSGCDLHVSALNYFPNNFRLTANKTQMSQFDPITSGFDGGLVSDGGEVTGINILNGFSGDGGGFDLDAFLNGASFSSTIVSEPSYQWLYPKPSGEFWTGSGSQYQRTTGVFGSVKDWMVAMYTGSGIGLEFSGIRSQSQLKVTITAASVSEWDAHPFHSLMLVDPTGKCDIDVKMTYESVQENPIYSEGIYLKPRVKNNYFEKTFLSNVLRENSYPVSLTPGEILGTAPSMQLQVDISGKYQVAGNDLDVSYINTSEKDYNKYIVPAISDYAFLNAGAAEGGTYDGLPAREATVFPETMLFSAARGQEFYPATANLPALKNKDFSYIYDVVDQKRYYNSILGFSEETHFADTRYYNQPSEYILATQGQTLSEAKKNYIS